MRLQGVFSLRNRLSHLAGNFGAWRRITVHLPARPLEGGVVTRLLIVDGNEMNRDTLLRRLVRRGYEVLAAANGIDGVEKARSTLPDLILMDFSLPEMDGWTATKILKSDPATRAIPVVALTAHAMSADRAKAIAAGCDAFETKPVDLTHLLKTMTRVLEKRNKMTRRNPTLER
jgi:two-component system cell cycle response regulator DivK